MDLRRNQSKMVFFFRGKPLQTIFFSSPPQESKRKTVRALLTLMDYSAMTNAVILPFPAMMIMMMMTMMIELGSKRRNFFSGNENIFLWGHAWIWEYVNENRSELFCDELTKWSHQISGPISLIRVLIKSKSPVVIETTNISS